MKSRRIRETPHGFYYEVSSHPRDKRIADYTDGDLVRAKYEAWNLSDTLQLQAIFDELYRRGLRDEPGYYTVVARNPSLVSEYSIFETSLYKKLPGC